MEAPQDTIESGWDSRVVVEGAFVVKIPRRSKVEDRLEREARLLAELAPTLPAAVPRPRLVRREGLLCLRYRFLEGTSPTSGTPALAAELGGFLRALHSFPPERAEAAGAPAFDPETWRDAFADRCAEFAARVLPLLDPDERRRGRELFDGFLHGRLGFEPALVHGDLGPEHVLVDGSGRLAAVLDWTDARVGDPALDLAWALHGFGRAFGDALAAACGGVDPPARERARFYHRIGPWYEVVYGLDTGRPDLVASGLAGVRGRL